MLFLVLFWLLEWEKMPVGRLLLRPDRFGLFLTAAVFLEVAWLQQKKKKKKKKKSKDALVACGSSHEK